MAENQATADPTPAPEEAALDVRTTNCVVVGGGPAGVILSLLLARKGVPVTLLEAHQDFDRDFRGDTVHPSTLEILDQIGVADRLLTLPHSKLQQLAIVTAEGKTVLADLGRLRSRFPYVMLVPQAKFLAFLAEEAQKYPNFHLEFGANVQRLVREDGVVRGVAYRGSDNAWHEVRAPLTVAADGRFSKLRSLLGLEAVKTSPPMDVVWLRLPRQADDPHIGGALYIQGGRFAIVLEREAEWQIGYIIFKGGFAQLRAAGIEALQQALKAAIPWVGQRVEVLKDWHQTSVLSVESSLLPCWHVPGLLLIGDAAHVMSPVGGVGINCAIQDAVEACNVLLEPLRKGQVTPPLLAEVQRRRMLPVRAIQTFQRFMQNRIAAPALTGKPFRPPLMMRILTSIPLLRDVPGQLIAFGIRRVRIENP